MTRLLPVERRLAAPSKKSVSQVPQNQKVGEPADTGDARLQRSAGIINCRQISPGRWNMTSTAVRQLYKKQHFPLALQSGKYTNQLSFKGVPWSYNRHRIR